MYKSVWAGAHNLVLQWWLCFFWPLCLLYSYLTLFFVYQCCVTCMMTVVLFDSHIDPKILETKRQRFQWYLPLAIVIFSMLDSSIGKCSKSRHLNVYWCVFVVGFSMIFGSIWLYYEKVHYMFVGFFQVSFIIPSISIASVL